MSYDSHKECRSRRSASKPAVTRRIGGYRYVIGSKTAVVQRSAPIIPSSHSNQAAYTHGKLRILAHKHEIWSLRVLEVSKLIIIKLIDHIQFSHRICFKSVAESYYTVTFLQLFYLLLRRAYSHHRQRKRTQQ